MLRQIRSGLVRCKRPKIFSLTEGVRSLAPQRFSRWSRAVRNRMFRFSHRRVVDQTQSGTAGRLLRQRFVQISP